MFHCFTHCGTTSVLFCWFVCVVERFLLFLSGDWLSPFLAFDAQGRHSSQDCHHRHDERSTGAKKNKQFGLAGFSMPVCDFQSLVYFDDGRNACNMLVASSCWIQSMLTTRLGMVGANLTTYHLLSTTGDSLVHSYFSGDLRLPLSS